ncbi:MAG: SpoIIE family protein phosphatase, partial [Candidatus Methanomethylophilaceae archaeon]|nr:SpoIIE family protein phosphatase [Candidatus Methanomethylophilaceae archaeon]
EGTLSVQHVAGTLDSMTSKLGNLDTLIESLVYNGQLNSLFIGTPDGVFFICDARQQEKYNEDGTLKTYIVTSRPWYIDSVASGELYFSDIEKDSFSDDVGIVCAYPVYADGKLVAVVGADLFVNSISDYIESSYSEGSFTVIVNNKLEIIFAPERQDIFDTGKMVPERNLREYLAAAVAGDRDLHVIDVEGTEYFMTAAKIAAIDWTAVSVVDKKMTQAPSESMIAAFGQISMTAADEFNEGMAKSRVTSMVLILIVFVVGSTVSIVLSTRIVKPLTKMTENIRHLSANDLAFEMDDSYKTKDEVEILAMSFADLSFRTRKYIEEITRITAEKERIGAELNVATQIQSDMLPRIFPPFPLRFEFDIYAGMRPAKEVGGDFYDFFMVDEHHIALVIADVSGKGVPAALFMVIAKTLIKNRTMQGGTPSEILEDVNRQLCEGNEAELFVTVWLAIIDLRTGEGFAGNAGHEHPAIRHKGGKFELVEYPHSPAVAMMEGMTFKQRAFKLEPGDDLFVYTDGVPEATNSKKELFGTERMLAALNEQSSEFPKRTVKNVRAAISGFTDGATQFDDITMLCFHFNCMSGLWITRDFEAKTSKLDAVLQFVDGQLEEHGCGMKEQMAIDIAVEELFVNIAHYAYEHGGKAVVGMRFTEEPRAVEIAFRDTGMSFDPLDRDDPDITMPAEEREIGGLGIYMVKKSMDDVRYRRLDNVNELTIVKRF